MVFGLSKREREEAAREKAADREARIIAERKYKAEKRRGYVQNRGKQGYAAGKKEAAKPQGGLGMGIVGGLEKFSAYSAKIAPNIDEFYGGTPRKGKKRKAGDEFGAFAI